MKRWLRLWLASFIVSSIGTIPALALPKQPSTLRRSQVVQTEPRFRKIRGSTVTDSTSISGTGGFGRADTTAPFVLQRSDVTSMIAAVNTTLYGVGKTIFWTTGPSTDIDTVFYSMDVSEDSLSWVEASVNSAATGTTGASGQQFWTNSFRYDWDLGFSLSGGMHFKFARFRVKADNAATAVFEGLRVTIPFYEFDQ